MTEKSEERIYREAKKRIDMRKKGIHPSDYFEGWVVDYIDSVTTDKLSVEKLQEQLNTAKKHIEHVIGTIKHDGHLGTIQTDWILPYLEKALAAIGGDDD